MNGSSLEHRADALITSESPLARFTRLAIRSEHIEALGGLVELYPGLIVKGEVTMVTAVPNGGKTTLFEMLIAPTMRQHPDVSALYYVNLDASGRQLEQAHRQAEKHNYHLIAPDMHEGESAASALELLEELADTDGSLDGQVFIIDTFKKLGDVLLKSSNKHILGTFRRLSMKGATVVLLGHANKYPDADGWPIYEGTGDIRSDVDALVCLIPYEDEGELLISVYGKPEWPYGKDRGAKLGGMTFRVDLFTRETEPVRKFADTRALIRDRAWFQQNRDDIDALRQLLEEAGGELTMAELKREGAQEIGKSPRQVQNIITQRNRFMPWALKDGARGRTRTVELITARERIERGIAI